MLKGQKILLVLLLWRTFAAAQTLEFVKFLNAPGRFFTALEC